MKTYIMYFKSSIDWNFIYKGSKHLQPPDKYKQKSIMIYHLTKLDSIQNMENRKRAQFVKKRETYTVLCGPWIYIVILENRLHTE